MLKDIPADLLKAHFDEFEGTVPHLYLDSNGFPTIWKGHLVSLPFFPRAYGVWLMPDMSPAGSGAVEDDMRRILSDLQRQQTAPLKDKHSAEWYGPFCTTKLSDDDGNRLFQEDLYRTETQLMRKILAYSHLPWRWTFALLDIGFNIGASGLTDGFPELMKGLEARDPFKCAKESERANPDGSELVTRRNERIRAMFLETAA